MDFFWLNNSGNIVYNAGHNHISAIVDQPEVFNITRKTITDAYKRFNERTGTEGKARDYITTIAMKKGWIRVRNYGDYWLFETWSLTDEQKNSIWDWVMIGKNINRYDFIVISQLYNNKIDRYKDKQEFKKSFMTDGVNLW